MINCYRIRDNEKFYIYGAGLQGRKICDNLLQTGFQVGCFIDKGCFQTPNYRGIPILPLSKILPQEYKDSTVIISVIDPFDHTEIGETLFEAGFRRIICKRGILQREQEFHVNTLYDTLASYHGNVSRAEILDMDFEEWTDEKYDFCDHAVLRRDGNDITAYLPVELIYAVGKPVIMQTQVVTLFEQMQGRNVNGVERFWEYACQVQNALPKAEMQKERNRIIQGRIKIYRSMVKALSLDSNFFLRHPVAVSRKKNVFEIKDGMHRTLFLYVNGHRYIPCSMPAEEYEQWIKETMESVKGLSSSITPVLHPYCYLWSAKTEDTYESRIDAIFRFLAEKNFHPQTALDLGGNDGWIARNLNRAGIKAFCDAEAEEMQRLALYDRVELTKVRTPLQSPGENTFDIAVRIDLKNSLPTPLTDIPQLLSYAKQYVFLEVENPFELQQHSFSYELLKVSTNLNRPFYKLFLVAIKK